MADCAFLRFMAFYSLSSHLRWNQSRQLDPNQFVHESDPQKNGTIDVLSNICIPRIDFYLPDENDTFVDPICIPIFGYQSFPEVEELRIRLEYTSYQEALAQGRNVVDGRNSQTRNTHGSEYERRLRTISNRYGPIFFTWNAEMPRSSRETVTYPLGTCSNQMCVEYKQIYLCIRSLNTDTSVWNSLREPDGRWGYKKAKARIKQEEISYRHQENQHDLHEIRMIHWQTQPKTPHNQMQVPMERQKIEISTQ